MDKGPIRFTIASIVFVALILGCNPSAPERMAMPDRQGDRYFQRTVNDYGGRPILKVTAEYTGKQPFKGYDTAVPWQTIDTDFYNIEFKNLTRNKVIFISKKVYQRNTQAVAGETADPITALKEFTDFTLETNPDFEPLEPREERKLINWAIHTNNKLSDDVANIVFRIRYGTYEYTFNIFLTYHK